MAGIVERVRSKERAVVVDALAAGAAAVQPLAGLARDEKDAEVRELAVRCLGEIGGEQAVAALVQALLDENGVVQGAALGALQKHATLASVPRLLDVLEKSPERTVREHVALIIGRVPGAKAESLRPRLDSEKDPVAREAALVAMARMGDPGARKAFLELLGRAPERDRPRLLERCGYVGADWPLPALVEWLDDWTKAVRVGAEGLPGPMYLRTCDVVVNLVAKLSGEKLSFKTGPNVVYTPPAIEEVRALLKKRAGRK